MSGKRCLVEGGTRCRILLADPWLLAPERICQANSLTARRASISALQFIISRCSVARSDLARQYPEEECMRVSFLTGFVALVAAVAVSAQNPSQVSPRAYVEEALNYMQNNALHKHSIDWHAVREQTLARAKDAKTTWDTYPAIAYAITQLGEKHTWFDLPDNLPAERRQALDGEIKKILARPDPLKPSPFMPSKELKGHLIHSSHGDLAYVVVPMCIGRFAEWEKNGPDFQQFADKLHGLVLELQAQKPLGWIIDLRGNGGGNVWPMLAGIGVVLGEADLGASVSADNEHLQSFYKDGKAGTRDPKGIEEVAAQVKLSPLTLPELPWVALLLDRGTASSGEAVAISFVGRIRERSFGEHTAGFSTANDMHQFPDGAALFLCTGVAQDRTGKLYPNGLDPDEIIPGPETRPDEANDAALIAAEQWLGKEAAGSR
jgi:carboxyl-terminal processing protease